MKIIVVSLLVVGSFLMGRYWTPAQQSVTSPEPAEESASSSSCEQLAQFKGDFEEYQLLKSEAEKYKKADEILGKIMLLFLADLGLHSQKIEAAALAPSSASQGQDSPEAPVQSLTPTPPGMPALEPQSRPSAHRRQIEVDLTEASQEAEAKELLAKLEIKDLFSELKNSNKPTDDQFQFINGHYQGEISFFDKRPRWTIDWYLDLRKVRGDWKGKSQIALTDSRGKTFSRTSGAGKPKGFLGLNEGQGLLVSVFGDDGYVQIYPVPRLDKIYGNYYNVKKIGQYEMIGTLVMQKVR